MTIVVSRPAKSVMVPFGSTHSFGTKDEEADTDIEDRMDPLHSWKIYWTVPNCAHGSNRTRHCPRPMGFLGSGDEDLRSDYHLKRTFGHQQLLHQG